MIPAKLFFLMLAVIWAVVVAVILVATAEQTVNMTIHPKTLTFCYEVNHRVDGEKVASIECNAVEMSNKKLKSVRDFLDNWTSGK